jgi:Uma2 family endonuclease
MSPQRARDPAEPLTFADLDAMPEDGRRYETLGVPGYWIVDPVRPSLTELRLSSDGRYTQQAAVFADQTLSTGYPFAVQVALSVLAWRE